MKFKIKNCLFFIIAFAIASCYTNEHTDEQRLTEAIPKNSDLIIKFHDIQKIYTQIKEFKWWDELQETLIFNHNLNTLTKLNQQYNIYEIFAEKTIYLSSVLVGSNQTEFLFITSISEEQQKLNKLIRTTQGNQNYTTLYEGVVINNLKTVTKDGNQKDVFFSIHDNIFLLSFSKIIIQESIRQIKSKTDLFKLYPISKLDQNLPKYSDLNILVKTPFLEKIIGKHNIFLNSETWSSFDMELNEDMILLNGVTNRGGIKYLKESEYSDAKKNNIEQILPRHTKGFYNYQINTNTDLNEVINTITEGAHENIYHLAHGNWFPTEINISYNDHLFSKISYLIFKVDKKANCLEFLYNNTKNKTTKEYLDYKIMEFNAPKKNEIDWLNQIMTKWNNKYYVIIDDYIVFSYSEKQIQSLINNKIANQTIGKSKALNTINEKLGTKSHTSFYLTFQEQKSTWKNTFNSIVSKNIASKEYFFNSIILLHENQEFKNPTIWSSSLDNETYYKPQLVTNHYTNNLEIFTQDIENNIYLLNKNGDRLWKKTIGNAILGNIHQIDRYKNEKLQYLFNTKDSIYLIDRNGDYVPPFPIKSEHPMSIPLALFDYDNNRNYRILIPMQNQLKMYNSSGQIVSGWEFLQTESKIQKTPNHYQVYNKDYIIIVEENGKTHLLNRKGQPRVQLKTRIDHGLNKMNLLKGNSLHETRLITKTKTGELINIYLDGEIDTTKINNLTNNDQYLVTNKYTIALKKQRLIFSSINSRFEYDLNTKLLPKINLFSYSDSILIGLHGENDNLIYLINQNGELHTQPMFGTTDFSIGKVSDINSINLIVGSTEGLIYNYQIN